MLLYTGLLLFLLFLMLLGGKNRWRQTLILWSFIYDDQVSRVWDARKKRFTPMHAQLSLEGEALHRNSIGVFQSQRVSHMYIPENG